MKLRKGNRVRVIKSNRAADILDRIFLDDSFQGKVGYVYDTEVQEIGRAGDSFNCVSVRFSSARDRAFLPETILKKL